MGPPSAHFAGGETEVQRGQGLEPRPAPDDQLPPEHWAALPVVVVGNAAENFLIPFRKKTSCALCRNRYSKITESGCFYGNIFHLMQMKEEA